MHIATAEGLLMPWEVINVDDHVSADNQTKEQLLKNIASRYVACMDDMSGRAPGNTCLIGVGRITADGSGYDRAPFNVNNGMSDVAYRER